MPEKVPESKNDEMIKRCEAILQIIKKNTKVSRPLLAKELGLTEKQVRAAVARLKSEGVLHYEGIGRGGHWVVKE